MKVSFSSIALADLEMIGDYVALDSPRAAIRLIKSLRKAAAEISRFPEKHARFPGFQSLRRRVHGNYLIIFQVSDDQIVIVRIIHGAQDLDNLAVTEN